MRFTEHNNSETPQKAARSFWWEAVHTIAVAEEACNTKMYTVFSHRLRNCAFSTTKNTDHRDCCIVQHGLPYLRTAWQIGIPYSENHKDHNHHQLVTSQPATAEEKERENERERESLWERVLRLPGSFVGGLSASTERRHAQRSVQYNYQLRTHLRQVNEVWTFGSAVSQAG